MSLRTSIPPIPWTEVNTVFLDMDGTLLDLHYDNYFWLEYLPERWAEVRGVETGTARQSLMERYDEVRGTLDWYCLDYWSRTLELDIIALKGQVRDRIAVQPGAVEFLEQLKESSKRVLLVTNAHPESLELKMEVTQLAHHFHELVTSHRLGVAKEDAEFWTLLQELEPFDRRHTLLIDDSLDVLHSAADYGIKYLLLPSRPDSRKEVKEESSFPAILEFSEIMPVHKRRIAR